VVSHRIFHRGGAEYAETKAKIGTRKWRKNVNTITVIQITSITSTMTSTAIATGMTTRIAMATITNTRSHMVTNTATSTIIPTVTIKITNTRVRTTTITIIRRGSTIRLMPPNSISAGCPAFAAR